MTVWTLTWQEGIPGEQVARELCEAAGVPLFDEVALFEAAEAAGLPPCRVAPSVPCGLERIGLSLAACLGAFAEPPSASAAAAAIGEARSGLLRAAARQSCVITAWGAFAVLGDRPGAVHAQLRAPLGWRVERYGASCVVGAAVAAGAIRRADRRQRAFLRQAHGRGLEDLGAFTLVCDASRLRIDALVCMLLDAADRERVAA